MSLAHEIIYGTPAGVSQRIEYGADVNEMDPYGFTPLIEAAIVNSVEIAEILINNGAEIDGPDVTGRTALHWAADNNNVPLCKLLLEHEANPNTYSRGGQSVLVYPLLRKQQTLKKLLYQYGASLNFAQDYINTKLLGHRFHLVGQVDIVDNTDRFIELNLEGFFLECTLSIVQNSLERYQNNFAARHLRSYFNYLGKIIDRFALASDLLKYQNYTIDINDHAAKIDKLLNNDLLLLPVAYKGHAVTFVKYKDFFARCDRGINSKKEGSIVIYHLNRSRALNTDFLKDLIYKPQSEEFITAGIKKALGLMPIMQLPLKSQLTGNCSWANVEASIPTILFLLLLDEKKKIRESDIVACKESAMAFYRNWLEWDKDRALEDCFHSFARASQARQASKAALLGAILFQRCNYQNPVDVARAEKMLQILTLPEYVYVLKSYLKIYWKNRKTPVGYNLLQMLETCGIKLDV